MADMIRVDPEALRAAAADADAVLAITPEYNGTIPAVLKNAIDWLSRPFGASAIKGKPVAVIGTALGQYGGVWAHDETRKSFVGNSVNHPGTKGKHVMKRALEAAVRTHLRKAVVARRR